MIANNSVEKISLFTLVFLITGAIDSIRNLATPALFGTSLIFYFIFSAIVFLIPVALVSAELASTFDDEEGGVYSWVHHAFGENWAFFAIWLQWINTMVWYPTILSFIAGTLAYLINPELGQNKLYLISVILITFWFLTFLGTTGIRTSARFATFCALVGLLFPILLMVALGIFWIFKGYPLQIDLNLNSIIPSFADNSSWISLTAIMTSFLGMELAAVHVRNINNPKKNFPKAMYFSVLIILLTMMLGSLSIAIILPKNEINLVNGVMQAFSAFLLHFNLKPIIPFMVFLLLIGSIGSMINWIISPAKGLLLAAKHGFLPANLVVVNKHGVAYKILILQALLVTLLCSAFMLFPSVNAIYWFFTDLSTELYILMYVIMFIAAIALKAKFAHKKRSFEITGGKFGYYAVCILGIVGCFITLIVGFFPPAESINISMVAYQYAFSIGIAILLLPAFVIYWIKRLKYGHFSLTL